MLRSLKIENFRCFRSFELNSLGRINLLVGANNSGKTSLLEAAQLFSAQFDPVSLRQFMSYRGEYSRGDTQIDTPVRRANKLFEISHLFYGHELNHENHLSILGITDLIKEKIVLSIESNLLKETPEIIEIDDSEVDESEEVSELALIIEWLGNKENQIKLPLLYDGKLEARYFERMSRVFSKIELERKTQFISPYSLDIFYLNSLFDNIVLTPDEQVVIQALQILEPKVERIASVRQEPYRREYRFPSTNLGERGGFLVKLLDSKKPIPIGSMGDGIWRMLALILAMVNVEGGVLLVDEIDSGLHFTTMYNMWKIIWHTAKKLNIQVFATTHNSDCWTSLASLICDEKISEEEQEIRIHHIDKDKEASILFDEDEIVIAAQRGIEIR